MKKVMLTLIIIFLVTFATMGFLNNGREDVTEKFKDAIESELEDFEQDENKEDTINSEQTDEAEDERKDKKDQEQEKSKDKYEKELAERKNGYVDLQEVSKSHPAMIVAEQELEQKAEQLEEEFHAEIKDLDRQQDVEKIQETQRRYQELMQNLQLEDEVIEEVLLDIEQARKELGLDLILDEMVVIGGGEDVTEEVIEYINK